MAVFYAEKAVILVSGELVVMKFVMDGNKVQKIQNFGAYSSRKLLFPWYDPEFYSERKEIFIDGFYESWSMKIMMLKAMLPLVLDY